MMRHDKSISSESRHSLKVQEAIRKESMREEKLTVCDRDRIAASRAAYAARERETQTAFKANEDEYAEARKKCAKKLASRAASPLLTFLGKRETKTTLR